jgi:hypothetical protein
LKYLAEDRDQLNKLSERGMAYVREHLTWDRKVKVETDILLWATGRGSKPKLRPPERATPLAQPQLLTEQESC